MYFDDKIKGRRGLPWMSGKNESDEYFEALEELAEQVDNVECDTDFMTDLDPMDFDNGYEYVKGRIKELRRYIKREMDEYEAEDLLDTLDDIKDELENLYDDSLLYDD